MSWVSKFNFLNVPVQLSQYHLLKTIIFPLNILRTLVKNKLSIDKRFIFRLSIIFLMLYMSVLMPVLHCFDYFSFVVNCEIRKWKYSTWFFCSRLFWFMGPIAIHVNSSICSFLQKIESGILTRIPLNL